VKETAFISDNIALFDYRHKRYIAQSDITDNFALAYFGRGRGELQRLKGFFILSIPFAL
jgi:hypothetical protein